MEISFDDIYFRAQQKHLEGAQEQAFAQIRPLIEYPGMMVTAQQWKLTWELLGGIAGGMGKEKLSHLSMRVALENEDSKVLYSLGYELNENEFPQMAATVLNEAHMLDPMNEAVLSELAVAFENAGMFDLAYLYLSGSIDFVPEGSICRYSLAFNALMCGEVEEARRMMEECMGKEKGQHKYAWERVQRILERLDLLGGELEKDKLREWHFVLTGGILLHRSLHGSEAKLPGRYQYFKDSSRVMRKGIERLRACFRTWGNSPKQVFYFPDTKSEILARAFATIEGVQAQAWSSENAHSPGLFVAYDLRKTSSKFVQGFETRREGQFLWAHMLCWVEDFPLTADFHTLMFQHNEDPGRVDGSVDLEFELQQILGTSYEENPYDPLENYLGFIHQVGQFPSVGVRERYFQGSPVKGRRTG